MGRHGLFSSGRVWRGLARQAWFVRFRNVLARFGQAGLVRFGAVRLVVARYCMAG